MKKDDTYEDMLHLPHHVSATHPPMSMQDRAAQFSPFAALTGYGDVIRETARVTQTREELDEYELDRLDQRFRFIAEHISDRPEVTITYFEPDPRKEGGTYLTVKGRIRKIREAGRRILMEDGTEIPFENVFDLDLG